MKKSEQMKAGYREILAAMAKAYFKPDGRDSQFDTVGHYHFFPSMKKSQMNAAIKKFIILFDGFPRFVYTCSFENHGCVWVDEEKGIGNLDAACYPKSYLNEIANTEIDMFSVNDRGTVINVVDVASYGLSVRAYNLNQDTAPPRYELLLNYPAARMLLMDRETLEVPEDELRSHFFRKD